jgi:syntaxin-binding protein 1
MQCPNEVFGTIQQNALLVSKIKTFKEISLDFLAQESNVFQFKLDNTLEKLFGTAKDSTYAAFLGRKLANVCITLNEHPSIRFQGNSPHAREIATSLHQTILSYKRANPTFWTYGDDHIHHERERAQILILDRSFDCLSPLMHEYTYQAMAQDLLAIEEGVVTYKTTTNKGSEQEKQGLLGENDEFWVELRHQHIAKVIEVIKERMNDIIQNNSGAALAKKSGADLDITTMAAAVKKLPEYTQTMTKLGQHVAIAQQCMDAFSKQGLLDLSQVEQTISTGLDEDGKEVKGQKLLQLVVEQLKKTKDHRTRLLAIYYVSQRNVPGGEEFIQQAIAAARLSPSEQLVITNFGRMMGPPEAPAAGGPDKKSGGMMSSFFGGKAAKHAPTAEGEYADTRHVCLLKSHLEQLMSNSLPLDRFPAMGPAPANASKSEAKSVRKFGTASKFGKKDNVQMSGVRYLSFIAGGVAYSELRTGYELMQKESREVIVGGSHIITPDSYLVDVGGLNQGR